MLGQLVNWLHPGISAERYNCFISLKKTNKTSASGSYEQEISSIIFLNTFHVCQRNRNRRLIQEKTHPHSCWEGSNDINGRIPRNMEIKDLKCWRCGWKLSYSCARHHGASHITRLGLPGWWGLWRDLRVDKRWNSYSLAKAHYYRDFFFLEPHPEELGSDQSQKWFSLLRLGSLGHLIPLSKKLRALKLGLFQRGNSCAALVADWHSMLRTLRRLLHAFSEQYVQSLSTLLMIPTGAAVTWMWQRPVCLNQQTAGWPP